MGPAIGETLGMAIGIAISPVPIIALILVLLSARSRANSIAFTLGWVIGVLALFAVVLVIGPTAPADGEADSGGILQLAIGGLFLVLAWTQWHQRPKAGEDAELPGWMASLDDLTVARGLGLGAFLGVPTLAVLIAGERARPTLETIRAWLAQHNAAVMTVLFTVLGANVLGKGLAGTF